MCLAEIIPCELDQDNTCVRIVLASLNICFGWRHTPDHYSQKEKVEIVHARPSTLICLA